VATELFNTAPSIFFDDHNFEARVAGWDPTSFVEAEATLSDENLQTRLSPKRWEFTSLEGISLIISQRNKHQWRLRITGPRTPKGDVCEVTRNISMDEEYITDVAATYMECITTMGHKLWAMVQKEYGKPIEQIKPNSLQVIIGMMRSPNEGMFDGMYAAFKSVIRGQAISWFVNVREDLPTWELHPDALISTDSFSAVSRSDGILFMAILMHGMWRKINDGRFRKEMEMAKNNDGKTWWFVTGGARPIRRLVTILQKNNHYFVQDNEESLYLRVQQKELSFVDSLTNDHNCRAKKCEEPTHGVTPCGINHLNPGYHERKCKSCKRQKDNEIAAQKTAQAKEAAEAARLAEEQAKVARAEAGTQNMEAVADEPAFPSTTSPDGKFTSGVGSMLPQNPIIPPRNGRRSEEEEWASKNGEVIVVQGAKQGIDPQDFNALAMDYRRISDELLERANYYNNLAEQYEALLKPTDAVREAEAQLAAAKAAAGSEREAQVKILMALIEQGPPEA
jgi:hypothetical protein